jgi:hypothetical protein
MRLQKFITNNSQRCAKRLQKALTTKRPYDLSSVGLTCTLWSQGWRLLLLVVSALSFGPKLVPSPHVNRKLQGSSSNFLVAESLSLPFRRTVLNDIVTLRRFYLMPLSATRKPVQKRGSFSYSPSKVLVISPLHEEYYIVAYRRVAKRWL